MIEKKCDHCKTTKNLSEFFIVATGGNARASAFCKDCHAAGLIIHGYGYYGEKYKTPGDSTGG